MSETLPIGIHVLTWNAGASLQRALESVKDAAEILVIDGGSTDSTPAIAREFGATILPQRSEGQGTPLRDFAAARNRGLLRATQPWILSLDSDETASPELLTEVRATIAAGIPCACFVPRRYVLPDGKMVTHASTYPNARLYFFHRNVVERWAKPVHEKPLLKPGTPIYRLRHGTLAPLGTLEEYQRKNTRYLLLEAEADRGKGWKHWLAHRLLRALRSRTIALIRLLWIWCFPHKNCVRLPLRHELMRFWYAWQLIITTCPLSQNNDRCFPLPAGEG